MQLNNIKLELVRANMKQDDLAAKMGMHYNSISSWVNNKKQPPLKKLYQIAAAIGVPTTKLLVEHNPFAQQTATNEKA